MDSFVNPKPQVVVLGGGNGASLLLRALKSFADRFSITGIIAMSDSGGSSGFLRKKYGVLPPGDILRALIALSKYDSDVLQEIFYAQRFPALESLRDLPENAPNLGNLLLTFLQHDAGGIIPAIATLEQALAAVGQVFPITTTYTHLCAELSDGTTIKGEGELDKPKFSRALSIKHLFIEPEITAYAPALTALREADYIFFGPGDVYTSIIATLVPSGVFKALEESQARFVQVVARSKHEFGEPSPIKLSKVIEEVGAYLPRPVDSVLYNNAIITPQQRARYAEKKWLPLEHDLESIRVPLYGADFEQVEGGYSWQKLAAVLHTFLDESENRQ